MSPGEPNDEPQLSRVTVVVGTRRIDVGLPAGVGASVLAGVVIDIVNDEPGLQPDVRYDNTDGRWTLARPLGNRLDPHTSLAEAGVRDGDVLVVADSGAVTPAVLVESIDGTVDRSGHRWSGPATWFGVACAFAAAAALVVLFGAPTRLIGVPVPAALSLIIGICCAGVALVRAFGSRGGPRSAWLSAFALPLIFGGALRAIPEVQGVQALPMALALTALITVLQLLIAGVGRAWCTAVVVLAVAATPLTIVNWFWDVPITAVGAIMATAAVVLVYLAPSATIALSRLPVPRVPTAGEPLDDVEIQGAPAVEGVSAISRVVPTEEDLGERVRRAGEHLTGIIIAAVIVAVTGCCLAVDRDGGFHWQGMALGILVGVAMCLRGRRHHVRTQATALIGGGLVSAVAVIVKAAMWVTGWQADAALMLTALCVLLVVCGLIAPAIEFSPIARRFVEVVEYLAVGLIIPLAAWILGIYAYFRELQI